MMREYVGEGFDIVSLAKKSSKNPLGFFNEFVNIDTTRGYAAGIKLIKITNISINKYDHPNVAKSWEMVLNYVINKYGKSAEIKKLLTESKKIKNLYNTIKEHTSFLEQEVPQELHLTTLLLSTEIKLRIRKDDTHDLLLNDRDPLSITEHSKLISEFTTFFDEDIRRIAFAFKNYIRKNSYPISYEEIDYQHVALFTNHFAYTQLWDLAHDIEEWWMIDAIDILGGKNKLKIRVKDPVAQKSLIISNKRNLNLRRNLSNLFYNEYIKLENKRYNRSLPPYSFFDEHEFISANFCYKYFSDPTLTDTYHDIKLCEWIRAYSIIRYIGNWFLENRLPTALSLENWCHIKDRSWWEQTFIIHGLSKKSARLIIDCLIFTSQSNDSLDTPFFQNDDEIIFLPTIASNIEAGLTILSNLKSKNHISLRGDRFEETIRVLLMQHGIRCKKMKLCDIVVVVDNVLFLFECKAYAGQYSVRDHALLHNNILNDSKAFNKNIDDLLVDIKSIEKEFGLPKDWQPRAIYKSFILMGRIGQAEKFNGCHVIDEAMLITFLERNSFKLVTPDVKPYEEKFWEYEGHITAEKFIKLITSPRVIEILDAQCEIFNATSQIGELQIHYQCYLKSTPDFYVF